MSSLKAYIKKEFLEGLRTHKFLILIAGILFFAVLDPVMMKVLPDILKSQLGDIDMSSMVDFSQRGVMNSHFKNLFQISTFVIAIALMGIVAGEKSEKTLTMPVSMGCNQSSVILAKWIVYSGVLTVTVVIGMLFAYFYAGLLFENHFASYAIIIKAGLLHGMYFSFLVSLLIALSTLFKNAFLSGIITLITAFGMAAMGSFFPIIERFLPTQLLTEAKMFNLLPSVDLGVSMIWTIGSIALLLIFSATKLKSDELV